MFCVFFAVNIFLRGSKLKKKFGGGSIFLNFLFGGQKKILGKGPKKIWGGGPNLFSSFLFGGQHFFFFCGGIQKF